MESLESSAMELSIYADADELCVALTDAGDQTGNVLLLMADVATNCRMAHWAGMRDMGLLRMALMTHFVSYEQSALLVAGVDWLVRLDETPEHMAAMIRAWVLRHITSGLSHEIGPWSLQAQAWVLAHESEGQIRLSVSERALLVCLFEAPGHVASHDTLMQALMQGWQEASRHIGDRQPRLRAVFSRFRQRSQDIGLNPPIESLRSFGYLWRL